MPVEGIPFTGGEPSCVFFTYQEFLARFGSTNIISASNKGDSDAGTADLGSIQQSMDYSVDALYDGVSPGIYVIPLDFTPNSGVVPPRVKEWAMVLAMENLYNARGLQDANADPVGDKYTAMAQRVKKEMARARYGIRDRLPAAVGMSGAITVVDTRPAAAAAGYPVTQVANEWGW